MHKSKKIKMRVYGRLEATPAALFPLDYFYYSVKLFSTFMITIDDLFDASGTGADEGYKIYVIFI